MCSPTSGSVLDTFKIILVVKWLAVVLDAPEPSGQTVHQAMLGGMWVPGDGGQCLMQAADAHRPIGAQLLQDDNVQTHVQERILITQFGHEISLENAVRVGERALVLRVQTDDLDDLRLHRIEGPTRSGLGPRIDESATMGLAVC
jgi:hypothetical protein